jgi:recombination protein RecT
MAVANGNGKAVVGATANAPDIVMRPTDRNAPAVTVSAATPATASERFTAAVLKEFGNIAGTLEVSAAQRRLIQGYFVAIDLALKAAEEKREKSGRDKDKLAPKYEWANVNMPDLAVDVVQYSRMGLDMRLPNHLSAIPYHNQRTGKYDVTLMPGYAGIQYMAIKYALTLPKDVTVEVVYSNDIFTPTKKSSSNHIEGYAFEITKPFDRGDIVGGFGYIQYDDPVKNKLVIMTLDDIRKRKPKYASAEFWGGTKREWQNGKQVEVETDGWYKEMVEKTIKREVYSTKYLPLDPSKIDDAYQYAKMREARYAEIAVEAEIAESANAVLIESKEPVKALPSKPASVGVGTATQETVDFSQAGKPATATGTGDGMEF